MGMGCGSGLVGDLPTVLRRPMIQGVFCLISHEERIQPESGVMRKPKS
jgi:hypothetical protein